MTLTVSNTIIDEEIRTPATGTADEHDVSTATFDASGFKTALTALSLTPFSSATGFPQYAEKTNFVSSSNPVSDYFLTGSATGTPLPATGTATLLKVGDTTVFLFPTSDPNIVIGRVGTEGGAVDTANASGAIAFVIGIEETKAGGFVTQADMWIALYANLTHNGTDLVDSADQLDLNGLLYLGSTFDTTTEVPFSDFSDVPSGNNTFNVIFPTGTATDLQLLVTGSASETLGTVNVSTQGIGANSQHVENGATLRIDTVKGMVQGNVDDPPEVSNSANIDYTDRVNLVAANFEITQTNANGKPADLRIDCFQVAGTSQEAAYLTNAIATDGAAVQIDAADVRILNAAGVDITATWEARAGTSITQSGNGVIVTGLLEDDRVAFTTDSVQFDRFLITNVDSKETFDVGNINVTSVQGGTGTEFAELGSHLRFQDDGPAIALASAPSVAALTADETTSGTDPSGSFAGFFDTPDAGADSPASVGYTLGVTLSGGAAPNCGLVDTATGDAIFLFLEGGVVKGRSGDNAAAAAGGPVVFEISVDASGNVTLDQKSAVVHTDSNDHNSISAALTASLITLTATVSDGEPDATDDSATATASIGDMFLFRDDGPALTAQAAGSATPNDLRVDNDLGDPADSTDSSSYGLVPGADGQQSYSLVGPDSSGDFQWSYDDPADKTAITGTYKGNDLYTLVLDPTDGSYDFTMIGTLPGAPLQLSSDEIKAGGPQTNSIEVGVLGTDPRFVNIAATGGPINESNDNVGVTNGNFDTGEGLTFTFMNGATALSFFGMNIGTKSASGGTYNWSATPTAGGPALTGTAMIAKNGTIVIDTGGTAVNSITLTKASGSTTKIGLDDIDILVPPADVQLGFTVQLGDGDDDTATASFVVDIDADNDGDWEASVSSLSAGGPDSLKLSEFRAELRSEFDSNQLMQHHDFFLI